MSSYQHSVTYNLNVDAVSMETQLLRVSAALYGILGILRSMGLPDKIDDVITKLQKVIAMLNMLRITYMSVMAATGPFNVLMAGVATVGTVLTLADVN